MIRAENILKNVGGTISDRLLIAMILKGLPNEYNTFTTVMTQKDTPMTFQNFKTAQKNFEETGKTEGNAEINVKEKKFSGRPTPPLPRENKTRFDGACFLCGKYGHKSQN